MLSIMLVTFQGTKSLIKLYGIIFVLGNIVERNETLEIDSSGFNFWFPHLLTLWPLASYITSLAPFFCM